MKYRRLPIENALENCSDDAELAAARAEYAHQLFSCPGFQLIVVLLRDLEYQALEGLRAGVGPRDVHATMIRTVAYIRRCLDELVPDAQQDWGDTTEEKFLPDYEEFMPAR